MKTRIEQLKRMELQQMLNRNHPEYVLGTLVGKGGFSLVYELEGTGKGQKKVIKCSDVVYHYCDYIGESDVEPETLYAEKEYQVLERAMRRELRLMKAATEKRASHIVPALDAFWIDEEPEVTGLLCRRPVSFLVMPFRKILTDLPKEKLTPAVVFQVLTDCARGLEILHAESAESPESVVIHRDIKPDNIFYTEDENGNFDFEIGDFGLSKQLNITSRSSIVLAKDGYKAPELLVGSKKLTPATDIFSLGMVAYRLFTESDKRVHRFYDAILEGEQLQDFRPDCLTGGQAQERTWNLIRKAVSYRPEDRFQSAKAFRLEADACRDLFLQEAAPGKAAEGYLPEKPVPQAPAPVSVTGEKEEKAVKKSGKKGIVIAAAALAAALAAGGIITGIILASGSGETDSGTGSSVASVQTDTSTASFSMDSSGEGSAAAYDLSILKASFCGTQMITYERDLQVYEKRKLADGSVYELSALPYLFFSDPDRNRVVLIFQDRDQKTYAAAMTCSLEEDGLLTLIPDSVSPSEAAAESDAVDAIKKAEEIRLAGNITYTYGVDFKTKRAAFLIYGEKTAFYQDYGILSGGILHASGSLSAGSEALRLSAYDSLTEEDRTVQGIDLSWDPKKETGELTLYFADGGKTTAATVESGNGRAFTVTDIEETHPYNGRMKTYSISGRRLDFQVYNTEPYGLIVYGESIYRYQAPLDVVED